MKVCHVFVGVYIDGIWIDELDLLTTCTLHSELYVITTLSLIYNLQSTVTHTLGFSVFTICIQSMDFETVIITCKVFPSQAKFQLSTELAVISSQSS
jgi:hypothetical protein